MKKCICYFVLIAIWVTAIFSGCNGSAVQPEEDSIAQTPAATATPIPTAAQTATPVPTPTLPPVSDDILAFWSNPRQYMMDSLRMLPEMDSLLSDPSVMAEGDGLPIYFSYLGFSNETLGEDGPDGCCRYFITIPVQPGVWDQETLSDFIGEALGIDYKDDEFPLYDENNTEVPYRHAKGNQDAYFDSDLFYNNQISGEGNLYLRFAYSVLNENFVTLTQDCFARDIIHYPEVLDAYALTYDVSYDGNQYDDTHDKTGCVSITWWDVAEEDLPFIRQAIEQSGLTVAEEYENGYVVFYGGLDDEYFEGMSASIGNWAGDANPYYNVTYTIYYTAGA